MAEPYYATELRYLLKEARGKASSQYSLYKSTIRDRYDFNSFLYKNRFNYLYDMALGKSSYSKSAGNVSWATEQLVSELIKGKSAEYLAILAMGNVSGAASKGSGKTAGKTKAPASKGCNCFVAGTKVLTDEGEKNIEDIEVGDKLLAKDENNPDGELAYKEVTALYRNQRDDIIKLHVGEQIIETTYNHPFWVEGKEWVFADELQAGDKLQKADGSHLTIDQVEFVKLDKPVTVYNFTVEDFHTYYVTDLGIWVHNTNCPKGWIQRDVHEDIQKSLGKEAAKKFGDAMNKGFVNDSKGSNGIKRLSGSGEKIGNTYYQYEIKIVGKYGNARVYGNYDEKTGHIMFTKFVKSH
ncbi:polymorphic toxin-type HINT domain-containing protein [Paenibacillus xylanexedens]|uniref:polymorphic toxin-type HINT domain-containing protein n=1 Tax=Paenibacillus xylanexedens TaxID=528191 RepID=UPI00119CBBFA|nr:polymorphic toxin-type HINT domain-containing protein [Paenibacillus xylanexedens]